jgi:hypothetical protein
VSLLSKAKRRREGAHASAATHQKEPEKKKRRRKSDGTDDDESESDAGLLDDPEGDASSSVSSSTSAVDFSSMKVTELRAELEKRGLDKKGKKAQLIARLEKATSDAKAEGVGAAKAKRNMEKKTNKKKKQEHEEKAKAAKAAEEAEDKLEKEISAAADAALEDDFSIPSVSLSPTPGDAKAGDEDAGDDDVDALLAEADALLGL